MNVLDQDNSPLAGKCAAHATIHLALERTFLAWIRTSLAVIGLGFAVAKFGTWLRELSGQSAQMAETARSTQSVIMGTAMIAAGGAFSLVAAWRYHVVSRQIEAGIVRSAGTTVTLVTVAVVILAAVVGGLTLLGTH